MTMIPKNQTYTDTETKDSHCKVHDGENHSTCQFDQMKHDNQQANVNGEVVLVTDDAFPAPREKGFAGLQQPIVGVLGRRR